MRFNLVSIHTMDPRGSKVGGIETHIRHVLRHHPSDARMIMVGIDERGDLPLGRFTTIEIEGRAIDFMPLLHVKPAAQVNAAASLSSSVTLRFAMRLLRALPRLRAVLGDRPAVVEVERVELALPARLLRRPLIVLLHNEGQRGDKMDSILGRHWWVHEAAEWFAVRLASRLFCVTQKLRDRVAARHIDYGSRIGVRTVSVDCDLFRPHPFDLQDGKLRLVYAGRLDAFKDPPLMFNVAARLHARLGGAFEFHYCGASDPSAFSEFIPIEAFTHCHGALSPRQVAQVMQRSHIGMLTSFYEGMPCFLLELLASGRPFAGVRLPQFEQVVKEGASGAMVQRRTNRVDTAEDITDVVMDVWRDIKAGAYRPETIADHIADFAVTRQLAGMFDLMGRLAHQDRPGPITPQLITAGE